MLEIKYERLDEAVKQIFDKNPKEHDIGMLYESIVKHGYREPAVFDATLKAIVAGNGRTEALWQIYIDWCADVITEVPKGIRLADDEMWLVPVLYGVDAITYKDAIAYLIDSNNLTMAGGSLTALDMSRAWDMGQYLELLKEALGKTVSVDNEDYLLMLQLANGESIDEETAAPTKSQEDDFYYLRIAFMTRDDYEQAKAVLDEINKEDQGDWFLNKL